jgi:hypothetical protein
VASNPSFPKIKSLKDGSMWFKSQLIKAILSFLLLFSTGCQKKENAFILSQNLRLATGSFH